MLRIGKRLLVAIALVISVGSLQGCDYTKTKYPIVLCHGFMGFDRALGIMSYWFGIVEFLKKDGATVYVTEVSVTNSSTVRGEQLIDQLEEIRAIRNAPNQKFNLIGHSQGGLDIRYVAGVRPDLVASLTTIATPHRGTDLINTLGGVGNLSQGLLDVLGDVFDLYGTLMGNNNPNDVAAAMALFDPASLAVFNSRYPGGMPSTACGQGASVTQTWKGPIRNYSWTGAASLTNSADIIDPVWGIFSLLYDERNDGLVESCGAHFGQVLRDDYRMNHLDEVNQLFALVSVFETNPLSVFHAHAQRLKSAGL